jgi:hypothetical protein
MPTSGFISALPVLVRCGLLFGRLTRLLKVEMRYEPRGAKNVLLPSAALALPF